MPFPRTQRVGKHDISLKILHKVGFETARQTATLTKLRIQTVVPRPSPAIINSVTSSGEGIDCRRQNLTSYIRQILTFKVVSRTESVKAYSLWNCNVVIATPRR